MAEKEPKSKIESLAMLKELNRLEDRNLTRMKRTVKSKILRACAPEAKVVAACYGSGGFTWCLSEVEAFWACYHEKLDFYTSKYVKDYERIGAGAITKKYLDTDFHWNPKVKENSDDDANEGRGFNI